MRRVSRSRRLAGVVDVLAHLGVELAQPVVRVGISSCLLGNPVRFYGGHKQDRHLRDTLGAFMECFALLPLIVPVTLLAHYTRVCGEPWLARQHYLLQHPRELMLRNHV